MNQFPCQPGHHRTLTPTRLSNQQNYFISNVRQSNQILNQPQNQSINLNYQQATKQQANINISSQQQSELQKIKDINSQLLKEIEEKNTNITQLELEIKDLNQKNSQIDEKQIYELISQNSELVTILKSNKIKLKEQNQQIQNQVYEINQNKQLNKNYQKIQKENIQLSQTIEKMKLETIKSQQLFQQQEMEMQTQLMLAKRQNVLLQQEQQRILQDKRYEYEQLKTQVVFLQNQLQIYRSTDSKTRNTHKSSINNTNFENNSDQFDQIESQFIEINNYLSSKIKSIKHNSKQKDVYQTNSIQSSQSFKHQNNDQQQQNAPADNIKLGYKTSEFYIDKQSSFDFENN